MGFIQRTQHGSQAGPLKATFDDGKFVIFDTTVEIDDGDLIDRQLPNGKLERYEVVEVHIQNAFQDIPACIEIIARKHGRPLPVDKPRVLNVSINNSQGFQVGDYNTQNIIDSFKQVIERLEHSSGKPEEKKEAKARLRKFLEHPLTSAIIGGALGSLTELLG